MNKYLIRSTDYYHVSQDTVLDLENEILKQKKFASQLGLPTVAKKILAKLLKYLPVLNRIPGLLYKPHEYFIVLMGICQISKSYPYYLFRAGRKSVYLFDAWEPEFGRIERFIREFRIDFAFFSAKQSMEYFSDKLMGTKCFWIPEGIDIEQYYSKQKDIDIMQFGRKHDQYHQNIVDYCKDGGAKYLYEKTGDIIFPDKAGFIDALARTKISICFPSNVTHPVRSGKVSTMTQRYLQSMASKCLILGAMPEDMKELFSYMPIIEAQMSDPISQIKELLQNYNKYKPLIERNYNEVLNNHLWKNRVETINSLLEMSE